MKDAFANSRYEKDVTHALLDRWNINDTYLASYQNYRITSQSLSFLCGERYLSDEIINLLTQKFCDKANQSKKACHNLLLPSFLSSGCGVLSNVVERICLDNDMESVVTMFLPVHMVERCHWGLAIFSVEEQTIFFDDGYHCPIPDNLRRNAVEILSIMYQVTQNKRYQPSKWNNVRRFKTDLPFNKDIKRHCCWILPFCAFDCTVFALNCQCGILKTITINAGIDEPLLSVVIPTK